MASHARGPLGYIRENNGTYLDTCPDCGTVSVAKSLDDLDALECACKRTPLRTEYHLELVCSLCGDLYATLVVPSSASRVFFTHTIHCKRCGGTVYAPDPPELVRIFANPTFRPLKRGRPSKHELEKAS